MHKHNAGSAQGHWSTLSNNILHLGRGSNLFGHKIMEIKGQERFCRVDQWINNCFQNEFLKGQKPFFVVDEGTKTIFEVMTFLGEKVMAQGLCFAKR